MTALTAVNDKEKHIKGKPPVPPLLTAVNNKEKHIKGKSPVPPLLTAVNAHANPQCLFGVIGHADPSHLTEQVQRHLGYGPGMLVPVPLR